MGKICPPPLVRIGSTDLPKIGGASAQWHPWYLQFHHSYSLIHKNGYTFASVYSSKCVTIFLNQTLHSISSALAWGVKAFMKFTRFFLTQLERYNPQKCFKMLHNGVKIPLYFLIWSSKFELVLFLSICSITYSYCATTETFFRGRASVVPQYLRSVGESQTNNLLNLNSAHCSKVKSYLW